MNSAAQIIDALGGNTAVSRAIGAGASTVSEWKRSNSIPVRYWPRLIAIAGGAGVRLSSDILVSAHAGEPVDAHAAEQGEHNSGCSNQNSGEDF